MYLSNFASLFPYKGSGMNLSPFNQLLQSDDITLEKLLDDESFVNEFKSQNQKLLQFMKYQQYKTLVQYVTVVGPEQDNKRGYKFPFIACQVLSIQSNTPIDFLMPQKELFIQQQLIEEKQVEEYVPSNTSNNQSNQKVQQIQNQISESEKIEKERVKNEMTQKNQNIIEKSNYQQGTIKISVKKQFITKVNRSVPPLIDKLFNYIQGEVNYTLAGYFCKILLSLFNKKGNALINYFFSNKKYIKIVDHIQSRSIAQIIIKFLTIQINIFIEQRQQLLLILLNKLSNAYQVNAMGNLSYTLCDVIQKFANTIKTVPGSKQMLAYIYSVTFCQQIMRNVISNDQISIYNTPVLLSSLISIRNLLQNKQNGKNNQLNDKFQELINYIKSNLGNQSQLSELFRNFYLSALQKFYITKKTHATFGFGRNKLIQLFLYLIRFDFFCVRKCLSSTNFFTILLKLMREYQLNNVLHNQILKIITFVLQLQEDSALLKNLLIDANILNFMYEQILIDKQIIKNIKNKKRVSRRGYIGHIVKIGEIIIKVSGTNNQINLLFLDDKWSIVKQFIDQQNYHNQKNLGGFTTKKQDNHNVNFSREDILTFHHQFLNQPPRTTYPQPVIDDNKEDQLQQTMKQFQRLQLRTQAKKQETSQTAKQVTSQTQNKQKQEQSSENVQKIEIKKQVENLSQIKKKQSQQSTLNSQIQKKDNISQENKQTQIHQHHHIHHKLTQKQKEQQKQKKQIAEKVEEQKLREVEQGLQIYSDVKYWKQTGKMKYDVSDLMSDLEIS